MCDGVCESPATPSAWPKKTCEYELKEIIGLGSLARVYSAYCTPRKEKCAVKMIDGARFKAVTKDLLQEFQVMSTYSHPNLVSYYKSFVVKDTIWLVLGFLEGGSLRDTIDYRRRKIPNRRHGVLDETTIATVLRSVLSGLEYLNSKGLSHRDIKASNILIGNKGNIQITDYGIAGWLTAGSNIGRQGEPTEFIGSPFWMAPEVMEEDKKPDSKADIWSVGITAIQMATGNPPYYKYPPMTVIKLTLQRDPPNLDTGADQKDQYHTYGKTFRKFIATCLKKDPAQRPTATGLLQHPFLKKARDGDLLTKTLVPIGPSYVTRVQKAKRREYDKCVVLHRTTADPMKVNQPLGIRELAGSFDMGSKGHKQESNVIYARKWSKDKGKVAGRPSNSDSQNLHQDDPSNETQCRVQDEDRLSTPNALKPITIGLKIRNRCGIMKYIRFEYFKDKDTPETLTKELLEAGELDPQDVVAMARYFHELLSCENMTLPKGRMITFNLNSTDPNEEYDEQKLIGFAQLFIMS